MAYSPAAIERRRCTATRRDGQGCRAWARWDDPQQRCRAHSALPAHGGKIKMTRTPCTCRAYPFPHRPGAGYCRWPEEPLAIAVYPPGDRHTVPRHIRRRWARLCRATKE